MTATTRTDFGQRTEALEVAEAHKESIRGRTILITGVNASQSPARLIIAGRNIERVQASIDALKAKFPAVDYRALRLDLGSQKAVRAAAAEVLAWDDVPTVDMVVNSAGIMMLPERTLSEDGIELHFATNHLGHFLLTNLILPKLVQAAAGRPKGSTRIINVTSLSPMFAGIRWSDINFDKLNKDLPTDEQPSYEVLNSWGFKDSENKSYVPLEGYNQSKVANVLFSIGLNRRLYEKHGILSLAVHPGVIFTELGRNTAPETMAAAGELLKAGVYTVKTQGGGSATSLVAATDPGLAGPEARDGQENYGVYLIDCQINEKTPARVSSSELADRLWKLSEKLVKEEFAS